MNSQRAYTLLALLLFSVILVCTGHMDLDWQLVTYRFDSVQNTWEYWEYCPFIRIGWWTAYFLNIIRIAVGWLIFGMTLTYLGLALTGKLKNA